MRFDVPPPDNSLEGLAERLRSLCLRLGPDAPSLIDLVAQPDLEARLAGDTMRLVVDAFDELAGRVSERDDELEMGFGWISTIPSPQAIPSVSSLRIASWNLAEGFVIALGEFFFFLTTTKSVKSAIGRDGDWTKGMSHFFRVLFMACILTCQQKCTSLSWTQ